MTADIPEDIRQTALALYLDLMTTCERWSDEVDTYDVPAIARALLAERMAERQRCAAWHDHCAEQFSEANGQYAAWHRASAEAILSPDAKSSVDKTR